MEMKGIIEQSILWEDAEIYRGRVRCRVRKKKLQIQTESGNGVKFSPRRAAWADGEAECQREVYQEQQGKGRCQLQHGRKHVMRRDRAEIKARKT